MPHHHQASSLSGFHRLRSALLLAGCLGAVPLTPAQTPATAPATATAPTSPAPQVEVARLDAVWIQPEREAPASVVPRNESRLSAETTGVLQRWTVDVGATVKRGQLLAQIDPRDAQLAVQRAQAAVNASSARLKLAQAQLRRSRELVAQGFYSQEALAQRETEVALVQTDASANQAQLATAKRQLAKTSLRAPFAGSVKQRLAQTGEAVAPGSVLYVLTETGASELQATITPADVPGLRQATDIRFVAAGTQHPVKLQRIDPTVSAPARTQVARLSFTADAPAAGSSGSLRWREARPHLPLSALVRRGEALGVFLLSSKGVRETAQFVAVPGAQEGRLAASPPELAADARLIVGGQAALQDGMAVTLRPAN